MFQRLEGRDGQLSYNNSCWCLFCPQGFQLSREASVKEKVSLEYGRGRMISFYFNFTLLDSTGATEDEYITDINTG